MDSLELIPENSIPKNESLENETELMKNIFDLEDQHQKWKQNMFIATGLFTAMGFSAIWWLYTELNRYKSFHSVMSEVLFHVKPETFRSIVNLLKTFKDGENAATMLEQAQASSRPVGVDPGQLDVPPSDSKRQEAMKQIAEFLDNEFSFITTKKMAAIALIALILTVFIVPLGTYISSKANSIEPSNSSSTEPPYVKWSDEIQEGKEYKIKLTEKGKHVQVNRRGGTLTNTFAGTNKITLIKREYEDGIVFNVYADGVRYLTLGENNLKGKYKDAFVYA